MRTNVRMRVSIATLVVLAGCGTGSGSGTTDASETSPAVRTSAPAPSEPLFSDPVGIAFDPSGDTWVADYRLSTMQRFGPSDISGSGEEHPHPSVVISDAGGPNQLRFGPDGKLWVVAYDEDSLLGYEPRQLGSSGHPRASVVIRGSHLGEPTDLEFDDSGRLWVANQTSGQVVAYGPDQLRASGNPAPQVVLRIPGYGAGTPEAIAFDHEGRLWVSDYDADRIVAIEPADLRTGSAAPAAHLQLTTLSGPIGLTIDAQDRLWIAEATASAVVVYLVSASGVSRRPVMTLEDPSLTMPHRVTFDDRGDAWIPYYNGMVGRFRSARLEGGRVEGADLIVG